MAPVKKSGRTRKAAKKAPARRGAKKAAKKAPARKAAKKGARKAAKKAPAKKRKPNPAFMRPLQPSADLAAVVGAKPVPRTEVTKKVWEYIKKNKLQDGRTINADANLKKIFDGRSQVTMFEMTKYVSKHLK